MSACDQHKPQQQNKSHGAVRALLRAHSLRVTIPRETVLRVLVEAHAPVSVEEIHRAAGVEKTDLVTVYRNVEIFEKAGIVQRHLLENGKNLYCLAGHRHHHHVICRTCGHIDQIDGCGAEKFERIAIDMGYKNVSHVFELYGVCRKCSKNDADR
ncbi:MAG: transcriptional repressor [Puniceicoccales bacterium]|jgi:Fe2+ or Zn2+ uptake regulation protein|nr:transcriptional repressor [Puniceicoccales bacterium]